jgi:hypothetical protein
MRKTNPIWSALGPGPEAKCAKRTQFGPAGQGQGGAKRLTASLQTCETNPISPGRGGGRRKLRKTKPNLDGLGHLGEGRQRVGRGAPASEACETNPIWTGSGPVLGQNAQNKAKLRGTGTSGQRLSSCGGLRLDVKRAKRTQFRPAGPADGGNCAEQSQTWGDWGIWVKGVVWAVARPGSETCETNPIGPARPEMGTGRRATWPSRRAIVRNEANLEVSGFPFEIATVRSERACARASRVAGHAAAVGQVSPRVPGSGVLDKPSGLPGLSKRASGDGDPQRDLSRLGTHARPPIRSGAGSAKSMGRAPSAGRAVRRDGGVVGIRWQSVRLS